jgi:hypothetical protein
VGDASSNQKCLKHPSVISNEDSGTLTPPGHDNQIGADADDSPHIEHLRGFPDYQAILRNINPTAGPVRLTPEFRSDQTGHHNMLDHRTDNELPMTSNYSGVAKGVAKFACHTRKKKRT